MVTVIDDIFCHTNFLIEIIGQLVQSFVSFYIHSIQGLFHLKQADTLKILKIQNILYKKIYIIYFIF